MSCTTKTTIERDFYIFSQISSPSNSLVRPFVPQLAHRFRLVCPSFLQFFLHLELRRCADALK